MASPQQTQRTRSPQGYKILRDLIVVTAKGLFVLNVDKRNVLSGGYFAFRTALSRGGFAGRGGLKKRLPPRLKKKLQVGTRVWNPTQLEEV